MDTSRYLFQSPYNSQVQFGRPDPSAQQNEKAKEAVGSLSKDTNPVVQEAQTFQQSQTTEVKPTVESPNKLDVYA